MERREGGGPGIGALTERLAPICRFDPARPELYRDSAALKAVLREAVPSYARAVPAGAPRTAAP